MMLPNVKISTIKNPTPADSLSFVGCHPYATNDPGRIRAIVRRGEHQFLAYFSTMGEYSTEYNQDTCASSF
ncbi:hypothetical protein Naga_100373g7 [Nannochloropsis gaditana]|uniref:Uncharacterized protein n=1 Tax=Nannochloropsis gaditana TaxID=72520 RepID=W7U7X3_9STRA|nr:hypothetical protein Naga_100373g7 [Nannochloropsis gaditana]